MSQLENEESQGHRQTLFTMELLSDRCHIWLQIPSYPALLCASIPEWASAGERGLGAFEGTARRLVARPGGHEGKPNADASSPAD